VKRPQVTPPCVPRRTTLLELVQSLAREGRSEPEIVATALALIESGQVILTGNFRGVPLRDPDDEAS
jgi:hypothetical protein